MFSFLNLGMALGAGTKWSLLMRGANKVVSIDLPGHGRDHTPIEEITLESYVDTLSAVLERETHEVVLVGHSRGGIVISQAAERRPEKVKMLVYLAAYLIPNVKRCFRRRFPTLNL